MEETYYILFLICYTYYMENNSNSIKNNLVKSWNKIYPPQDMKIKSYWSELSVHHDISEVLGKTLIPFTTQKIIFEEISNYNNLITDESRKLIFDILEEVKIYPKDLYSLVKLARIQPLSVYGKIISYLNWFKQWDIATILSEDNHPSIFNNLSKEEQLDLIKTLKRYLKNIWYERVKLHRDLYDYNNGKSFQYNPNDIDKENYRQAVQENISNIPNYHNDILYSIINHPQYQNIWKPFIIELHKLAEQSQITDMYIKAHEFMQKHNHTLLSDDMAYFIVICLHCNNNVRPIMRTLFYYFDMLHQVYKLQHITWYQDRRNYLLEDEKKSAINWIKRYINNKNYSDMGILDYKKTSETAITWLDNQGMEELSQHYIRYWYDISEVLIPPYQYRWDTFHFKTMTKDYKVDKSTENKIRSFSEIDFTTIYQRLREDHIQKLFLYEYIHNNFKNYSLEENNDNKSLRIIDKDNLHNYMREIEKSYIHKFQPDDLWYFKIILDIPTAIKSFCDEYDFDNSYPEFLMTSDPGHGISKLPWIDYRAKEHILKQNNMIDYLSESSWSDQIIILEDDFAQAHQYKNILSQHLKNITHITTHNDIKNHIKDDNNQVFILDLQQPDNAIWWIDAIKTIISHRETIGKENYNNLIRILLRSTSDDIYNIERHHQDLMTRWEQASVFIDFRKKWTWVIDKFI